MVVPPCRMPMFTCVRSISWSDVVFKSLAMCEVTLYLISTGEAQMRLIVLPLVCVGSFSGEVRMRLYCWVH